MERRQHSFLRDEMEALEGKLNLSKDAFSVPASFFFYLFIGDSFLGFREKLRMYVCFSLNG